MAHLSTHRIKRIIERIGGKFLSIECSKHAHVTFDYYGHECRALFPMSPSDSQWEQYKYNDIKRDLKAKGIWRGN